MYKRYHQLRSRPLACLRCALPVPLFAAALFIASSLVSAQPAATHSRTMDWDVLDLYCLDCHNFEDQAGGLAFDILARDNLAADQAAWEQAIRKVSTGFMPPAGKDRPAMAVLDQFVTDLGAQLDLAQAASPNPGAEGISRLNRAEYRNVVRDVLAFDASTIVDTLPADEVLDGFDNIAEVLSVSPTLIDAYAGAAMRISREAIGDLTMIPGQIRYDAPGGSQTAHVEGLPLGTRGGMRIAHYFPLDAEYEIRINTQGAGGVFNNQDFCAGPAVVITLNGLPLDVPDTAKFSLRIPAGEQVLIASLADDARCAGVNDFYDSYSIAGAVRSLEVHGPFDVSGPGVTPGRSRIFSCYPETAIQEPVCARQILTRLASSAYRRPLAETGDEIATLMGFYQQGTQLAGFETGIQYGIARMLLDPQFLYQLESRPEGLVAGDNYAISELELASRLSFFLWSSIPDQELINLAVAGQLREPAILETQVIRMLRDARAEALVENFAGQWLMLRELDAALPQDSAFNASLKSAFRQETEMLFRDLIVEDVGLLHLFSSNYTYLNAELASHYGIPGVRGDYMRRVNLPADSPRGGLLGHGSILTATSVANRTSPVLRGKWIVENVLGAPVPAPPPGVETDLSKNTADDGREAHTLRDRLELHLGDPLCAACHQIMDPIGFALENFDLVGRWREQESGYALDTTTTMIDGTPVRGPADLRAALLTRSETIANSIIRRLLTYALGRSLEAYDMPAVRNIANNSREEDYRFSRVILGIVTSLPFQYKRVVDEIDCGSQTTASNAVERDPELLARQE